MGQMSSAAAVGYLDAVRKVTDRDATLVTWKTPENAYDVTDRRWGLAEGYGVRYHDSAPGETRYALLNVPRKMATMITAIIDDGHDAKAYSTIGYGDQPIGAINPWSGHPVPFTECNPMVILGPVQVQSDPWLPGPSLCFHVKVGKVA